MRAELMLMGRRVDMARRTRRRTLVVMIYAVMAAVMVAMWFLDHFAHTGVWVYLLVIVLGKLFLGGYYRGGLVKPFKDNPHRKSAEPPPFLAVGLRVYNPMPEDDASFLNDERELAQRDHAHYLAYQAVAASLLVLWFLSGLIDSPRWAATLGASPHQLLYGLIGATLLLAFTLPQAILLWTEPDMEEGQ